MQAVLRSQVALAAKGNGPAQRFLFETVQAIEQAVAIYSPPSALDTAPRNASDRDLAKALVLLFARNATQPSE